MTGINNLIEVYLREFNRRSREKLAIWEPWPKMTLCWQEVPRRKKKNVIYEVCQKNTMSNERRL